ncbi:hypothetical protein TNCV_1230581 [Trichonephila clavipes]|nr:hypothetical protein TNCV_1230581 [Trichonephila clavipes]
MTWSVAKSPRVAEQCDVNIQSINQSKSAVTMGDPMEALLELYYQNGDSVSSALQSYRDKKGVKDLLLTSFVASLPRLSDLIRDAKRQLSMPISHHTYRSVVLRYSQHCPSTTALDCVKGVAVLSRINDTGPSSYRGPNMCNYSPTNRALISKKAPQRSFDTEPT